VAAAHRGESAFAPVVEAAAQQQMEASPSQRLAQPAHLAVSGDARVGHPVAGSWTTPQCRLASWTAGLAGS
jgi:hypothetical protein